jgi:thiol:disulfide interchange protein
MRTILSLMFAFVLLAPAVQAQRGPANAQLTAVVERTSMTAGGEIHAALQVTLPDGYHTNSNRPRDPLLIPVTLTFDPPAGIEIAEVVFPKPTDLTQRGADQPLSVFEHEFTIGLVIKTDAAHAPGEVTLPAEFRYQACDEVACYPPKREAVKWTVTIGKTASGAQHAAVFKAIAWGTGEAPTLKGATGAGRAGEAGGAGGTGAAAAGGPGGPGAPATLADDLAALDDFKETGTTFGYLGASDFLTFIHNAEQGIREKGWFEGRGPIAILLLVLVGGLALNLTPCVLPMIPINLAIIGAGSQARSSSRGFLLGLVYGAAMALVYGILGLVVVLTASTFGTINASPWFNLSIAILFVVLALAMFDVLVIDFSRFSSNLTFGESGSGSMVVAFGMGAVAALLAGACVAPVVIQVVLFSSDLYAGGNRFGLALPFLLGVGMAIPWPLAGAGIAALPRPGAWMVRIKQVFGVIILATAAYYGYEAYGIFANRWVDPNEVSASVEEMLKEGWHPSIAEGLAVARRERKPVLIDMWATWCKNCLVMDGTTLKDPAVQSALSGYVKVKFQAEDPDDEHVAKVMKALNSSGLPTYVILQPK